MTSKEALKVLRQYNSVGLCGDKTLFEPIEKDLEDYEELKELMVTPIQDIMKRLEILEILKQSLKIGGYKVDSFSTVIRDVYCILDESGMIFLTFENKEQYDLIKEWLENDTI